MGVVSARSPVGALLMSAGAVGSLLVLRPRLRRWGATSDEVTRPLPGDEILPRGIAPSTMGATVAAPPGHVWPWLVQMGSGRAGWYSWDRLDNGGTPSAREIVPAWQDIQLGDRIDSRPSGETWFTVARLEPEQVLVLRGCVDLDTGRSFDPDSGRPRRFLDSTWAFHLDHLPGERTRLLVRTRGVGRPRLGVDVLGWLFFEPAHVIMQPRQLRNLKRRAEGAYRDELRRQIPPARGPEDADVEPHHW